MSDDQPTEVHHNWLVGTSQQYGMPTGRIGLTFTWQEFSWLLDPDNSVHTENLQGMSTMTLHILKAYLEENNRLVTQELLRRHTPNYVGGGDGGYHSGATVESGYYGEDPA